MPKFKTMARRLLMKFLKKITLSWATSAGNYGFAAAGVSELFSLAENQTLRSSRYCHAKIFQHYSLHAQTRHSHKTFPGITFHYLYFIGQRHEVVREAVI